MAPTIQPKQAQAHQKKQAINSKLKRNFSTHAYIWPQTTNHFKTLAHIRDTSMVINLNNPAFEDLHQANGGQEEHQGASPYDHPGAFS